MTSPTAAPNSLEICLKELESLGLGRPASVLFTEYLAALTAEGVVDHETSQQVAAAYHRARYGVDSDDLGMQSVESRLEAAVAAIIAMTPEARGELVDRIRHRLQPFGSIHVAAPIEVAPPLVAAQPRIEARSTTYGNVPTSAPTAGSVLASPADSVASAEPQPTPGRRGLRLRSLSLETATLVALALFFTGYFFRNAVDRAIDRNLMELPASGRNRVLARDVWRSSEYFTGNLRKRAEAELARRRDQSAHLAFELLLSYSPRDATVLNDLAWVYLTSEDPAVRNPKRALELASRAVKISRTPNILDTAAEAQFQAGDPAEAVKLEQEALGAITGFADGEYEPFRTRLEGHLQRFQTEPPRGT